MQKMPYVFPIVGGRKVEHLNANLEALDVVLTPEHIKKIEGAVPFEPGFPMGFIVSAAVDIELSLSVLRMKTLTAMTLKGDGSEYNLGYQMAGHFDKWPAAQAIRPAKM